MAQTASSYCGHHTPTALQCSNERRHSSLQCGSHLGPFLSPLRSCHRLRYNFARPSQHLKLQTRSDVSVRAAVDQEPKTEKEQKEKAEGPGASGQQDPEEVTKKYGLEAGLWQIFKSKDGETSESKGKSRGQQAKDLLAKYGVAYIGTSVALSLISITVCYLLINSGVDVPALLEKVGIHTNEQGEKVGTFALAYAAHKALSPVRFPPTVALTPVVANFFGKKADESGGEK